MTVNARSAAAALAACLLSFGSASAAPDDSCGVPPGAERCAAWRASYDGAGGADRFDDTELSPDGSVQFATGYTGASDGTTKYLTAAFDTATGSRLWATLEDGSGAGNDRALDVEVAPDGSAVYVTGDVFNLGAGTDVATVAYDAVTGTQLWLTTYAGPVGGDNSVAVEVSADGARVYTTGYASLPGSTGPIGAVTVAYDAATGTELWQRIHRGPASFWDIPRAMEAVGRGSSDLVLVATRSNVQGTANNQVDSGLVAYDGVTGDVVWTTYYDYYGNGGAREEPWGIVASRDGARAYATIEGPWGFNTVAYDLSDGTILWYRADVVGSSRPLGIAVSPAGDKVVVTGMTPHPQLANLYRAVETVAYSSSGALLWTDRFFPTGGGTGIRAAFDPGGRRVYVSGLLVGQAFGGSVNLFGLGHGGYLTYSGLLTLAYDAGNGHRAWQATASESGGANGIVVHPDASRVLVAGGQTDAVTAAYETGF